MRYAEMLYGTHIYTQNHFVVKILYQKKLTLHNISGARRSSCTLPIQGSAVWKDDWSLTARVFKQTPELVPRSSLTNYGELETSPGHEMNQHCWKIIHHHMSFGQSINYRHIRPHLCTVHYTLHIAFTAKNSYSNNSRTVNLFSLKILTCSLNFISR